MGRESRRLKLHFEALNAAQRKVLAQVGPVLNKEGFYLAGGTAVALHLGHRRSIDLDWFTNEQMADPLRLQEVLAGSKVTLHAVRTAPGTIHGTVQKVNVSFLAQRYPMIERTIGVNQDEFQLASLDDLACMKLLAI